MKKYQQKVSNTTVINVPISSELQFFRYWVEFTKPIHKVSQRDMDLLALLLYKRYKLSNTINDSKLIDSILFSTESRKELREELNIPSNYFQVMLKHLRDKKVIIGNSINQKLIPRLQKTESVYKLIMQFSFDENH